MGRLSGPPNREDPLRSPVLGFLKIRGYLLGGTKHKGFYMLGSMSRSSYLWKLLVLSQHKLKESYLRLRM